ncbi:uncharacterized protein [Gossypium hirsutum]|uniref:Uncharacterized protein n=1 Tax=Gossypium hirsutum TaxID=3635 RepID=A0A1U8KX24_GOSHI|nr:uncharacterized protein LOC107921621 [Gossypium hirsutum]
MARIRCLTKKANKSIEEHASSATAVCESEPSKPAKKVVEEEKEREEKDFDVNIFAALESVGANIENLELDGARPTKVAKVASPIQDATDDAGAEPEHEEQFENYEKSKDKKRKLSKDKTEENKRRRKKHRAATAMAADN